MGEKAREMRGLYTNCTVVRTQDRLATSLATARAGLFRIRLEFPHAKLAPIPELVVARVPLPTSLSAFHGVIGRALLRRWESFCYQGRRGRLTIRDTPGWLWRWIDR